MLTNVPDKTRKSSEKLHKKAEKTADFRHVRRNPPFLLFNKISLLF